MEERQPSAAGRARQTMTIKPFCVSNTRKGATSLLKLFFFFFFCSCHTRTFAVHSRPPYRLTYLYFYWRESNTTALSAQIIGGADALWINGVENIGEGFSRMEQFSAAEGRSDQARGDPQRVPARAPPATHTPRSLRWQQSVHSSWVRKLRQVSIDWFVLGAFASAGVNQGLHAEHRTATIRLLTIKPNHQSRSGQP